MIWDMVSTLVRADGEHAFPALPAEVILDSEVLFIQSSDVEGSNVHGPASGVDCFKTDVCLGKDVIDSVQVKVHRVPPCWLTRWISKGAGTREAPSGRGRVGRTVWRLKPSRVDQVRHHAGRFDLVHHPVPILHRLDCDGGALVTASEEPSQRAPLMRDTPLAHESAFASLHRRQRVVLVRGKRDILHRAAPPLRGSHHGVTPTRRVLHRVRGGAALSWHQSLGSSKGA